MLPAIAISAHARDEDERVALASGFQIHVVKPVAPGALQAAIRTLAERASST
jgi:CheY-like chemotaxis protein